MAALGVAAVVSGPACARAQKIELVSLSAQYMPGLMAGVRLFSTFWLTGTFGHSFYRRFDQRNAGHGLVTGGRQDIPNVPVIRVNASWKLPPGD